MSTLIVYGSKYGCTDKCAKKVANKLMDKVDIVNLRNMKDIDPLKYDNIIIGGPIYMGKIQKEVSEFCSKHLNILKTKSIGLFICGMQEHDIIETELNTNFPPELLNIAKSKAYLGGEFIFDKMNFMEKMIVKKIAKVTSNKSNILEGNISNFIESMNRI